MSLMMTEIVIGTEIFLIFMLKVVPIGMNDKYNMKAILFILKLYKCNIINRLDVQDFYERKMLSKYIYPTITICYVHVVIIAVVFGAEVGGVKDSNLDHLLPRHYKMISIGLF